MAHWLLKTEPKSYSFQDLSRDRRTRWDGVTNPQAVANLRAMRAGDSLLVYHSGEKRVMGLAELVREAYPDPADPERVAVDVAAGGELAAPVPLAALRSDPAFRDSPLLRQGRLSVVPITAGQWSAVERLGKGATRRP